MKQASLKYIISGKITIYRKDFESREDFEQSIQYYKSAAKDKGVLWEVLQDLCDGDVEQMGIINKVKLTLK